MNVKKIIALLLAALLVLSLAACGTTGQTHDMTERSPDGEPKNAQEAAAMYKEPDGSGECHSDRKTSPFGRRCSCPPTRA